MDSHIKFKGELDLPFQLLADEGNEVILLVCPLCQRLGMVCSMVLSW